MPILKLKPLRDNRKQIIKILKDQIKTVQSSKKAHFCLTMVSTDDTRTTSWSGMVTTADGLVLVGAAELLKKKVMASVLSHSDYYDD